MKIKLGVTIMFSVLFLNAHAQWKNVKSTSIGFRIKNAGIGVDGSFKKASIQIFVDETNLSNSSFSGVIEANSISTGIKLRDNHLREKQEFFNVAKFPNLVMKSVSVIQKSAGVYTVVWDLTIKKITKQFTTQVIAKIESNLLYLSTDFTIDRNDWQVGGNSMTMGDNVIIKLRSTVSK